MSSRAGPPAIEGPSGNHARLDFLDALRLLALGVLIAYHVGMYYVTWDWHLKSPFANTGLEPWMRLVNPWRMSLLFLISGAVTAIQLERGAPEWLGVRLRRLGLPLVAGVLVIVPPQSYWQVVKQMGYFRGRFTRASKPPRILGRFTLAE